MTIHFLGTFFRIPEMAKSKYSDSNPKLTSWLCFQIVLKTWDFFAGKYAIVVLPLLSNTISKLLSPVSLLFFIAIIGSYIHRPGIGNFFV